MIKYVNSYWLFPLAVILIFVVLVVTGVSGSSMGALDKIVTSQTPGVLVGHPRSIRSDEWLVDSQQILEQKAADYPAVNNNIGRGQDESLLDVPYKGLSVLFRPQDLFFFVLPFSMAFAAHWWFMALVMILGFYFLMTNLLPRKKLLISFGALLLLFNPFIQWWYEPTSLLGIGYGLWIGFFVIKLFGQKSSWFRLLLYSAGLIYSCLSFIFVLYPPFQLPVAYTILALLLGYFYHRYWVKKRSFSGDTNRWLIIAGSLIVVALCSLAYFSSHRTAIQTVERTSYPGVRNIVSGQIGLSEGIDQSMLSIFSAPILINLLNDVKAAHFYTNQSEAAKIVLVNLALMPVVLFAILKKNSRERGLADNLIIATSILIGVFLIRIFTPFFNEPFKLLLFNKVQNERLFIGLLLLCVIQLVLFGIASYHSLSIKKAVLVALLSFGVFFDASIIMVHRYPEYISTYGAFVSCLIIGLIIFALLQRKYYLVGMATLLIFNVTYSISVNPLYQRSEPSSLAMISQTITTKYPDQKYWAVFNQIVLENAPQLAGKPAYTGIDYYPQLNLWHNLDASNNYLSVYNRYAHVVFTDQSLPGNARFYNPSPDTLLINFGCSMAKNLPGFGHVLSATQLNVKALGCLQPDGTESFPNLTIYYYKYSL